MLVGDGGCGGSRARPLGTGSGSGMTKGAGRLTGCFRTNAPGVGSVRHVLTVRHPRPRSETPCALPTVHNRVSACAPDGQPKAPELKHLNNSHRFENLTWPEVNEAVEKGLIPILPVGTVEQHGPHLPIKMDLWTADSVANEAARRRPDRLVAMPVIPYGFTTHVMDFPGSVTVHHETFIRYVVDVLKSVVYHGFKKVIVVNGHGSNVPPLDLATRRVILETDAIVSLTSWWSLVSTDPDFTSKWRESEFPGGCAHACEVETSLALGIDESMVRKDLVESHRTWTTAQESKFESVDLFGFGPVAVTNWTSTYTETGVCGSAGLATVEKGKLLFEEAVTRLTEWGDEFHARQYPARKDHHSRPPTTDVPG